MGGPCSKRGGDEKWRQVFVVNPGRKGSIRNTLAKQARYNGMHYIQLA
jgi:hypothetical protein